MKHDEHYFCPKEDTLLFAKYVHIEINVNHGHSYNVLVVEYVNLLL